MVRLSPEEKAEIRRLAATGMPSRQIGRVIGHADRTVGDYIDDVLVLGSERTVAEYENHTLTPLVAAR